MKRYDGKRDRITYASKHKDATAIVVALALSTAGASVEHLALIVTIFWLCSVFLVGGLNVFIATNSKRIITGKV